MLSGIEIFNFLFLNFFVSGKKMLSGIEIFNFLFLNFFVSKFFCF